MKQPLSTITISGSALSLAMLAFAHGGFDHVMGTVAKVDKNIVTVATAKGNVDVKLDDKTEITKDDKKASVADLAIGLRVVVDLPENVKSPAAHSVKIGVAEAGHEGHK